MAEQEEMNSMQRHKSYLWPDTLRDVHRLLENKHPDRILFLPFFHLFAVSVFIGMFFHSYFAMRGYRLFYLIAFTEWGLFITFFTFVLFLMVSLFRRQGCCKRTVNKLAYVFFEIAWTAEVVITIVFWSILAVVDSEKAKEYDTEVLIFTAETHLVPIILLSVEFTCTKIRFTRQHAFIAAIPLILYTGVSIYFALVYDIHAYPILTWKDYKSAIFGPLILLLFAFGFWSGYWIGERKYRSAMRRAVHPPEQKVEQPVVEHTEADAVGEALLLNSGAST